MSCTGSKMRQMFEFVSQVGEQAAKTIKEQIKNGGDASFEFKDLARKFTVDVILFIYSKCQVSDGIIY
jgi:hypothetical protein